MSKIMYEATGEMAICGMEFMAEKLSNIMTDQMVSSFDTAIDSLISD